MKSSFAKGDFKAVTASAPALTAAIGNLGNTVKAKKAGMEAAAAQRKSRN